MDIKQLAGSKLDNYELQALLGRGGMGVLHKARQISRNGPIALNIHSLAFRLLVVKDKERSDAPTQFETEPVIWQGGLEYIDTPIGDFHLNVENDGTTVYIEYCPGPDYRYNKTIAKLSKEELIEAIQTGHEIAYSKRGFTIIFVFQEVDFVPEDGRIETLEAQVYRSKD